MIVIAGVRGIVRSDRPSASGSTSATNAHRRTLSSRASSLFPPPLLPHSWDIRPSGPEEARRGMGLRSSVDRNLAGLVVSAILLIIVL